MIDANNTVKTKIRHAPASLIVYPTPYNRPNNATGSLASPLTASVYALNEGGAGLDAYADAVATYLAFAVDKGANYWSSLSSWHSGRDTVTSTFGRQTLPMVWDFAEANPLSKSSGNFLAGISQANSQLLTAPANSNSLVPQSDAQTQTLSKDKVVSIDPPYYDNIGYADLSDFFYVWLRRSLKPILPDLFATLEVPKAQELAALKVEPPVRSAERHAGLQAAGSDGPAFANCIRGSGRSSPRNGGTPGMRNASRRPIPSTRRSSTSYTAPGPPWPSFSVPAACCASWLRSSIACGRKATGAR